MTHLQVGDKAPDFNAQNCLEQNVQLSNFKGKKLILFFYPKAMTPGCTAETVNLATHYKMLQEKGFEVLGVSPDTLSKQKRFKEKKEVPFSLIPDETKKIILKYGVWGPKKLYGRVYNGLHPLHLLLMKMAVLNILSRKLKPRRTANRF